MVALLAKNIYGSYEVAITILIFFLKKKKLEAVLQLISSINYRKIYNWQNNSTN